VAVHGYLILGSCPWLCMNVLACILKEVELHQKPILNDIVPLQRQMWWLEGKCHGIVPINRCMNSL
jgi:hypothetical protein